MTLYKWSRNESSNATADGTINWREGQAPSSVNDSARAMMAAVAKWRDDITGILIAGGTSTAYSIASNQGITANTDGFTVQFTPAANNGGAVTLSVDSQAAKPLRFRIGADLPAGVLISGSLYQATFRAASQEWLLHSFDSSVYSIPIGASVEYWGATAPNGAFAIPNGQAISRVTYATLFSLIGTTYGAGDGSSTFNLPNPAGYVLAQRELSSSKLTPSYFGSDSTTLGSVGGSQSHVLTTAQMPSHAHPNSLNESPHGHPGSTGDIQGAGSSFNTTQAASPGTNNTGISHSQILIIASALTGISINNASVGSDAAHNNIQPTMIVNRIMRVI